MLTELQIENIAVIKKLTLNFTEGFTALTGETGAGKSVIIDSMNLLLGGKIDRELIRVGEDKATVVGTFEGLDAETVALLDEGDIDHDGDTLIVRRVITQDGKSKSYIGASPVTLSAQKEIVGHLVSIHGQNDSQRMLQKKGHILLLDSYVKPGDLLERYQGAYKRYVALEKQIKALTADASEKERLKDTLALQIKEIEDAKLKVGEEAELKNEAERLKNIEAINHDVRLCYRALNGGEKSGAMDLIAKAMQSLDSLAKMIEIPAELYDRLAFAKSEVEDVAELVSVYGDDSDEDPTERLDKINARLFDVRRLEKKYGAEIEDVLSYLDDCKQKLKNLDNSETLLADLNAEKEKTYREVLSLGKSLHDLRVDGAKEVTDTVTETLGFLDMPKVRFAVSVEAGEPNANGVDDVGFMIATNPGEPLKPLGDIASGGELSRVMLALRSVLNDRDGCETVIFDEIDTGISGKTSRKVGLKMKAIAVGTQVLCVTHSAQIASLGDSHYFISKKEVDGRAETSVRLLTDDERIDEIARILGGINVTDAQRQSAKELIEGKETL